MDITLAGTGLTYRPNDSQLGGVSLEFAAFDGEVGTGILPVPDAEAAITVAGGRLATVEEGATLIGNQYIVDQDRDRGPTPAGTARQYSFGVMDANCLLGGFVVLRSRSAELDRARVLAFAAIDLPSADTSMVINESTVTMPKKHYDTDGGWAELITDLVEFTGKTLFLHDKADGSGLCLHYHLLTSGHTCGLTISDVAGAEDRVTVFAPWAPTRQRTSVDLVNTVRGRDSNGRIYTVADGPSIATHNVDGLKHQALIDFETTSMADLKVKSIAFLRSQKNEQDTFTCQIGPMDEDALALIRVGDLITVTSSVMGLTASVQRIAHIRQTVAMGEGGRARAGWWMAALELGQPLRRRARVKAAPPPKVLPPFTPECGITDTFDRADGPVGISDAGIAWVTDFLPDLSVIENNRFRMVRQPIGGGSQSHHLDFADDGVPYRGQVEFELTGLDIDSVDFGMGGSDVTIHPNNSGGSPDIEIYVGGAGANTTFVWEAGVPYNLLMTHDGTTARAKVWKTSDAEPGSWLLTLVTAPSVFGGYFYLSYLSVFAVVDEVIINDVDITGVCGSIMQPLPGQTIKDEIIGIGDGVTTVFTTDFAYRVESISLTASGLPEHDFAQTDPAAGTVTFGTAPFLGEVLRATYQAGT